MTSINAGGAFYRVQNELNSNSERVSESMQRLASGMQNIAPGDRTASTAVSFSMKAEAASLKIGLMNGTEALQALEMVNNDLSQLNDIVVRLEELHALGTNGFNTAEDIAAITREADKVISEMSAITGGAKWKGNDIIGASANSNNVSFGRNTSAIDIKLDAFVVPKVAFAFNTTGDANQIHIDKDGSAANTASYTAGETAVKISASTVSPGSSELAIGGEVFFEHLSAVGKGTSGLDVSADVTLDGKSVSSGSTYSAKALLNLKTLVDNMRIDAGALYNKVENTMAHMSSLNAGYQLDISSKMDVDFAGETTKLAKGQILSQAGTAMLAQANAQGQGMLALLQS